MRQEVQSSNARELDLFTGRLGTDKKTISTDHAIAPGASIHQVFSGGAADRSILLPVIEEGRFFIVANLGATNNLLLKDALGVLLTTILPGQSAFTVASGSVWTTLGISDVAWSQITGTPTTIAGYGITDAFTPTVPFLVSPGTSAQTLQQRFGIEITPQDFGAVGNGIADDTLPIKNWLDACSVNGVRGYVPKGTYLVTQVAVTLVGPVKIRGAGLGAKIKGAGGLSTPVILFIGGAGRHAVNCEWVDFDNSLRGYIGGTQSGTAVDLTDCDNSSFCFNRFLATNDYRNAFGDAGMSVVSSLNFRFCNNYVEGQPDLGLYLNGGVSAPTDDYGQMVITGNSFYRCAGGIGSKRSLPRTIVANNQFFECGIGVALLDVTGLEPGRDILVLGNYFKKIASRMFLTDIHTTGFNGIIFANNILEDWGTDLAGAAVSGSPPAVRIAGSKNGVYVGNVLRFRDYSPVGTRGFQLQLGTASEVPSGNIIANNNIQGTPQGVVESTSVTGNHGNNFFASDVTTPVTYAASSVSNFGIFRADGEKSQREIQVYQAADPRLVLAEGGSGNAPTSFTELTDLSPSQGRLRKVSASGASTVDLEAVPSDAISAATFRFFRSTNTSALAALHVFKGDNSATINHQLAGNSSSYLCADSGNLGIGTSAGAGTSADKVFHQAAGTAPTTAPADRAQMWVEDASGGAGKGAFHIMNEAAAQKLIVVGAIIKGTTGDPTMLQDGLLCVNTVDLTFKFCIGGAWKPVGPTYT